MTLFCLCWLFTADAAKKRANVIIIYADDLGYGDLQCYGHPTFKTPNLDQMAAEGARLTRFYSTAPYCAPSRAALLTGRYQFRSGVLQNPSPDAGIDNVGIPQDEMTLGEAFQGAGYKTACFGKWHLGHQKKFYPVNNGFDEYFGILYSNDMRPVQLVEGEEVVEHPVDQRQLTKRYTDRAIQFITTNKEKDFFLYLPHAMPHKPLAASNEFYDKSRAGLYGDVISELDANVGRLLAVLKDLKIDRETLVFFSSDNGPWYGGSTGGLRGMKASAFEGGIRVPLIARWPGMIPVGTVNDSMACTMDLFVTSLDVAGIPLPTARAIDGRNIMPLLTDRNAPTPHDALFSIVGPRLSTIQKDGWKLHVYKPGQRRTMRPGEEWLDPRAPDGLTILAQPEQSHPSEYPGLLSGDMPTLMMLFNLKIDPGEQHNVAKENPREVKKLKTIHSAMEKQMIEAGKTK
ncbi:sulfatase [Verrucomicrobia bacterium]|nr:sulfatase [Verrucomicrobiota bacterium]